MKKLTFIAGIFLITLTSCNQIARVTDSEISAIRDQTTVLQEQNELIEQQNQLLQIIADGIEFEQNH